MKSEMKLVLQHTTKVLTPHSLVRRAASEQVREAYQFGCGCWNSEGNKFNENDATRDFQIEGISSWQNSDSGSVEASSSSSRSKNGDPPSIIRLERVYYSTKTIPYHYSHDSSKTALQGSVSSTCGIEFQPSFIPQQKQVKTFRKETCKALHAEKKVVAISQTSVARPVKRKADCSSLWQFLVFRLTKSWAGIYSDLQPRRSSSTCSGILALNYWLRIQLRRW